MQERSDIKACVLHLVTQEPSALVHQRDRCRASQDEAQIEILLIDSQLEPKPLHPFPPPFPPFPPLSPLSPLSTTSATATYLLTYFLTYLITYLLSYLLNYLLTFTYSLTCLRACLLTYYY